MLRKQHNRWWRRRKRWRQCMCRDGKQSMLHNKTPPLQTLNLSPPWKTCMRSCYHGDMICQGWMMLLHGVLSRLYSFCGDWVAPDPLAECPAGSLIPFGVRLSSLEELLIFPISQWGTSGYCNSGKWVEWASLYFHWPLYIILDAAGCTHFEEGKSDKCKAIKCTFNKPLWVFKCSYETYETVIPVTVWIMWKSKRLILKELQ